MNNKLGHNGGRSLEDLPEGFEVDFGHIVQDRAFYHPDLKNMLHGDRLLLAALGFSMKRGCNVTRMSVAYAKQLMGESLSTTKARFKRLRKLGWLHCIPGKGTRPTEWRLSLPPSELEESIRRAVDIFNAKKAASVPIYAATRGSPSGQPTHR
ncbi:unnamed protein product, partial [marine sediment metagenome]